MMDVKIGLLGTTSAENVGGRQRQVEINGTLFAVIFAVIAVVGIAVPFALIGGSLASLVSGHSYVQISDVPWLEHVFHTAPGLAFAILVGGALVFVVLHVAKGIGWFHGRLAEILLVRL